MIILDELRNKVHRLVNKMQGVLGYIEIEDYAKARDAAWQAVDEMKALAILLSSVTVVVPKEDDIKAVILPSPFEVLPIGVAADTIPMSDAEREKLKKLDSDGSLVVVPKELISRAAKVAKAVKQRRPHK